MDTLCDQLKGQNTAVACFYFDFTAQKEQTPTSILGALLKQVVGGLNEIPEKIVQAFRDQRNVVGSRGPGLSEIREMLKGVSTAQRTFLCIDALDECVSECRLKVLDSLKYILQRSPTTRIFLTGRPHTRRTVEKHLSGKITIVPIIPTESDIIRFLRLRLSEDTTPEAMDSSLEADILKSIPETVSEVYVGAADN